MNQPISLSFRYTEADYISALRAHYKTVLRLRLDLPAILVLVGIGSYLLFVPSWHWVGIFCLVAAGLLALLLIAAFFVIPPLAFRREPKFRDNYKLTFSPEGIHFRTETIDSHLKWSLYTRAIIDARSYVLYYGKTQFTVIPKRVFKNAGQQQAFEQMLNQYVQQIARKN